MIQRGPIGETYYIGVRTNLEAIPAFGSLLYRLEFCPWFAPPVDLIRHRSAGGDRGAGIDASKLENELAWRRRNVRERPRQDGTMASKEPTMVAGNTRSRLQGRLGLSELRVQ